MKQVSLYEAKTHLSKLVDEAASGEEIVIAKNGKPLARLAPLVQVMEPRKLGQWAPQNKNVDWDKWWRDWKAADKEIEADFEESIAKPLPGLAESAVVFRGAAKKSAKKTRVSPRKGKPKRSR